MKKNIRVFIVEDHPIVRDGLRMILKNDENIEICGEASDGNSALQKISKINPDLVITDISLNNSSSGLDLTSRIADEKPNIPVLVLSMYDETKYAERALTAGAKGYLMKDVMTNSILEAIHQIAGGGLYLSEKMKSLLISDYIYKKKRSITNGVDSLTNRELEVLKLTGKGFNSNRIAKLLEISAKTVDTYKLRIKEKMNLEDNTELIKMGVDINNQE